MLVPQTVVEFQEALGVADIAPRRVQKATHQKTGYMGGQFEGEIIRMERGVLVHNMDLCNRPRPIQAIDPIALAPLTYILRQLWMRLDPFPQLQQPIRQQLLLVFVHHFAKRGKAGLVFFLFFFFFRKVFRGKVQAFLVYEISIKKKRILFFIFFYIWDLNKVL